MPGYYPRISSSEQVSGYSASLFSPVQSISPNLEAWRVRSHARFIGLCMEKFEGERTSYRCCFCRGTMSWSICSPASPVVLDWKGKPPVSSWRWLEWRSGCRSPGCHRRRASSCRWPYCWCWSDRTNRSRWRYILSLPLSRLLVVDTPAEGHPSSARCRWSSWATRSCWWSMLVRCRLLATAEARTRSDGGHLSRKSTENYVNVFSPYD